jgi:hypothetical protein
LERLGSRTVISFFTSPPFYLTKNR